MPCSAGGYSTQLSFYSVKKENVNTFCKPWVTFLLFLFFFSMKTSCSDKKEEEKKTASKAAFKPTLFLSLLLKCRLQNVRPASVTLEKVSDRFYKNKDKDTHISWRFFKVGEQDCRVKIWDVHLCHTRFPLVLAWRVSENTRPLFFLDFFVPK